MGIVGPGWDMFLSLLCGRYLGVLVKNHHTVHLKLLHFILCKLQWTLDKALIDSFVFFLISIIGNTPTEWFQAQSWEGMCMVGSRAMVQASPSSPPLTPSSRWFWKQHRGMLKHHYLSETGRASADDAEGKGVLSRSQLATSTEAVNTRDPAAHPWVLTDIPRRHVLEVLRDKSSTQPEVHQK